MRWCWVQRGRKWLTLLQGVTLPVALLIFVYGMARSGTVTRTANWCFHLHSHWSCHQKPTKNAIYQKIPQNTFWTNQWNTIPSDSLDIWVAYNERWINLYCPLQTWLFNMQHNVPWCLGHLQLCRGHRGKRNLNEDTLCPNLNQKRVIRRVWCCTWIGELSPRCENTDVD